MTEEPITRRGKRKIAELDEISAKCDELPHGVSGKRICVTGKFKGNIHEVKNLLHLYEAVVQTNVKNADILLCGSGKHGIGGTKWKEAQDNYSATCKIVDEDWLSAEVRIQRKIRKPKGSFYMEETHYV